MSPRLLPAERGEPTALLAIGDEHQDVLLQKGRRILGTGPKSGPTDS